MAKSKALVAAEATNKELTQQVAEGKGTVAALQARLELAKIIYREQKARIADLESQLNSRGAKKVIPAPKAPVPFTKADGSVWVRIPHPTIRGRSTLKEVETIEV